MLASNIENNASLVLQSGENEKLLQGMSMGMRLTGPEKAVQQNNDFFEVYVPVLGDACVCPEEDSMEKIQYGNLVSTLAKINKSGL
jgi:hypothetical protein